MVRLGGSTDPSASVRAFSAALLRSTTGTVLPAGMGLGFIGGGGFAVMGLRRRFLRLIRLPLGRPGRLVTALGVAGSTTKGAPLMIVGTLFGSAAVTGDARQSTGLDSALRSLVSFRDGDGGDRDAAGGTPPGDEPIALEGIRATDSAHARLPCPPCILGERDHCSNSCDAPS